MSARPAITLDAGGATATVHPDAGGRLGQLDLGAGPLLRGPSPELGWAHWGCYPLVPWSNRLRDGRLRHGDLDARFPVNWPDGTAIHGLVADRPWEVAAQTPTTTRLEVDLVAGPFDLGCEQVYELDPDGLHLRLAATNRAPQPVPIGVGIHPWFVAGPVRVPAERRWPGEPMPTGPPVPVGAPWDLRRRQVAATMDTCFTGLTEAEADVPGARLSWEGPVTQVVVYTGEPGWVCVEPVTMATDGFEQARLGHPDHGIETLEPGATLVVTYRFARP